MPDNDTLLAYLVSSFPGRTEDIATAALRHILDRSDACLEALNDVVQSGVRGVNPITAVKSQVRQADGAVPDMVGYDETGEKRVLVEVKFWAELTRKQPNDYIRHLSSDGPAVLMFLAPEERVRWLWPQLRERLASEFGPLEEIDSERRCLRVEEAEKYLMVASWGGLLDSMAARTGDYSESRFETEIRQLRSLAKYADSGAFKPIGKGEAFGGDAEARLRLYQDLIDTSTERGVELGWASRNGLKKVRRPYGYGRYIELGGLVVWFGVNDTRFEEAGDTPLWIDCYYRRNELTDETCRELGIRDPYWAPIDIERDVEYPEMLDGVVASLQRVADTLRKVRSPAS